MLLAISNVIRWGIGVKIFNYLSCARLNFVKTKGANDHEKSSSI